MENSQEREVYYYKWCATCEFKDVPEADEPCNECLGQPYNIDSHKPVNYKEKV